jgi:hypothetical protein
MTATDEGALAGCRVLICDRDQKWTAPLRHMLEESSVRVVQTPFQAPNCNAHAERFVRSIKEECLNRVIPMGGAAFPEGDARVRRALPPRTQSSGSRQRAHRRPLVSRGRWEDSPSSATRRLAQLLLPRGMTGRVLGSAEFWDITRPVGGAGQDSRAAGLYAWTRLSGAQRPPGRRHASPLGWPAAAPTSTKSCSDAILARDRAVQDPPMQDVLEQS